MTAGVLAAFEPIYVGMGLGGWSPGDVDGMEVWQVARFLGDEDFDPVFRGTRDGLRLPSDAQPGDGKKLGKLGKKLGRFNPRKAKPQLTDPGRVLRGTDAH